MTEVKALFFDIFGTVVDWRGGIARQAKKILKPLGYKLDWIDFAQAWRDEYQPAMEDVRNGRIAFSKLDALHRRNLDRIRPRFGLDRLDERNCQSLNMAWHRLDAWPDATKGLKRLSKRFLLAPVSNGNISLMADLARHNGFRWDAILGAEIAGDYKPKPVVYRAACAAFDLAAASLHDGGGAQLRSESSGRLRIADRACRKAGRGRTGHRRKSSRHQGRRRGQELCRPGAKAEDLNAGRRRVDGFAAILRSLRQRSFTLSLTCGSCIFSLTSSAISRSLVRIGAGIAFATFGATALSDSRRARRQSSVMPSVVKVVSTPAMVCAMLPPI